MEGRRCSFLCLVAGCASIQNHAVERVVHINPCKREGSNECSGHNERRPSAEVSQRRDSHPAPGEPNTMFAQNLVEGLSRRPV